MKETIKIIILFILVLISGVFVVMTKGNDEFKWNVKFSLSMEEDFSYSIISSDYNGKFKNNKGNGIFALMGQNEDGTYRIYFIHEVSPAKKIIAKIDSGKLENNKINFTNKDGTPLYVTLGNNNIVVDADLGYGDAQLEGSYMKMKSINVFSMSEFE